MKHAVTNAMKRTLRVGHFLGLLFWTYPFRRELDEATRTVTSFYYIAVGVLLVVGLVLGGPRIPLYEFPSLEQAAMVEGHVIRHATSRGGKYSSEPLGIHTITVPVFKRCSTLGVECLDREYWERIDGRPARMWFWKEWVIQLEVDGVVPPRLSYETRSRTLTSDVVIKVIGLLCAIPLLLGLARLGRRYGRSAYKEVSHFDSTTRYFDSGDAQ